ncbi:unnamed protein product [Cladocopium goreaui]|uniref:Uncharacterized protein n=1 Tax=Cladocopium goreaui TaxID=2562237 RepID=A0A9P1GQJ4_9DINO|nr:unnamed protein product [Cladocopium goreaui]
MALSELWRFDAPPQARVKVTRDGFGVLLRQPSTCGATLYAFAPKVPQQLPLRSDARGMERGEVSWSTDGKYLASTGLEGKLQLLRKEENGYVEVALLEHGAWARDGGMEMSAEKRLSPHAAAMLVAFSAAPGAVAAPGAQLAAVARRCRAW